MLSDGCGALLNFQMSAGLGYGQTTREWYAELSWKGWRYVYFEQAETAERLFNYSWPYNQEGSQRAWDRASVNQLNVLISNVTTQGCVVEVARVEVLHQEPVATPHGTVLTLGTVPPLQLPLPALSVGQYVECVDMALPRKCQVFNADGTHVRATRWPASALPTASTASNEVPKTFRSSQTGAGDGVPPRGNTTMQRSRGGVPGGARGSDEIPVALHFPTAAAPRMAIIITEQSWERIGPYMLGPG